MDKLQLKKALDEIEEKTKDYFENMFVDFTKQTDYLKELCRQLYRMNELKKLQLYYIMGVI